jgi:hypothetical protein
MILIIEGAPMPDIFLTPGAPFAAIAVAGALIAALGLMQLERARLALAGVRALPTTWGVRGRFVLGQAAAVPLAATLLLLALGGGTGDNNRTLLLAAALALYLYVGVIIPRKPIVQAQKERKRLRLLTPGFVSYVRVALAGYDPPATLLERYAARPTRQILLMQRLVAEALLLMNERRLRPFEALRMVARARGCQELTDVTEALAQAENEGSDVQQVLAAHEATLEALLRDEFTRMLKRRTMYLLGLVAVSLVVGILGNLLFVMTGGGRLLTHIGG